MINKTEKRRVETRKRGNRLGFWIFRITIRIVGLWAAYAMLVFPCAYYLLFDREAVGSALAYIQHRFPGAGRLKRLWYVYRLFISQGMILIDRYVMLARPGYFNMDVRGYDKFAPLLSDEMGFILLTSHVGNWQAVMTTLGELEKKVCLLMRAEDNAAVREALAITKETDHVSIVSPDEHLGGVVELIKQISEGSIISIMGDRSYGYASEGIPFLGEKAAFPVGAFHIAAATQRPVVVLFTSRLERRRYRVEIAGLLHPYSEQRKDRKEVIHQAMREYARLLEDYVARHPFQCFLFHDVWRDVQERDA